MVVGIERFRNHFAGHEHQFVLIGGAACELIMDDAGLPFRATKDLDLVLIVEALDPAFADRFMAFIEAGQYEIRERSEGDRILYRFAKPTGDYPAMIELFSNAPEGLPIKDGDTLARLSIGEAAASLSAILLDPDYYAFLKSMVRNLQGIPVLQEEAIIPFKARAFIDLSARKAAGEEVSQKDIKKHRNDGARMVQLLPAGATYELPASVASDMAKFIDDLTEQEDFDPKQFGVTMSRDDVVERLLAAYRL